jgi:putative heme iron utilization protein
MSDEFSTEVSNRICTHMNDDHASAVLLYAQAYGGLADASAAKMLAIDAEGMDLDAQVQDKAVPVRIKFDHVLENAEDAHHTLIAMLKQLRQKA